MKRLGRIKYMLVWAVCMMVTSCNVRQNLGTELRVATGLGDLTERVFAGTLASGVHCNFVIYHYFHSGDGVFSMNILDAEKKLSVIKGTVYTLRGDNDATLWQCISDDGKRTFYFLLDLKNNRVFWEQGDSAYQQNIPLQSVSTRVIK